MAPAPVFEASGHVARSPDWNHWMVKDVKTGDVLRADHLMKGVLEAGLAGDLEARGVVIVNAAALAVEILRRRRRKRRVRWFASGGSREVVGRGD